MLLQQQQKQQQIPRQRNEGSRGKGDGAGERALSPCQSVGGGHSGDIPQPAAHAVRERVQGAGRYCLQGIGEEYDERVVPLVESQRDEHEGHNHQGEDGGPPQHRKIAQESMGSGACAAGRL